MTTQTQEPKTRRDFIVLAANTTMGVGAAAAVWPFIGSMNPAGDVLALASIEVDVSSVQPGQNITAMWRGKPVFIRRRTADEVRASEKVEIDKLIDPETDKERTLEGREEWLVAVGVCTHLGCVPLANAGEYHGWFCPCHGSHYDVSGRIRKGPAPKNLTVPPYAFISDTVIKIG